MKEGYQAAMGNTMTVWRIGLVCYLCCVGGVD